MMARALAEPAERLDSPLSAAEFRRLAGLASRLPLPWIASPRRRRLLLLGLAAPGFLLVAATPLHRALGLMALGFALFAAAFVFRQRTERVFIRAEAAALWPPATEAGAPTSRRNPHA
jgi:hypothetical protein